MDIHVNFDLLSQNYLKQLKHMFVAFTIWTTPPSPAIVSSGRRRRGIIIQSIEHVSIIITIAQGPFNFRRSFYCSASSSAPLSKRYSFVISSFFYPIPLPLPENKFNSNIYEKSDHQQQLTATTTKGGGDDDDGVDFEGWCVNVVISTSFLFPPPPPLSPQSSSLPAAPPPPPLPVKRFLFTAVAEAPFLLRNFRQNTAFNPSDVVEAGAALHDDEVQEEIVMQRSTIFIFTCYNPLLSYINIGTSSTISLRSHWWILKSSRSTFHAKSNHWSSTNHLFQINAIQ